MTTLQTLQRSQRVTWAVCGHSADAPAEHEHDWRHRHACPVCEPGRVDRQCPGVEFRNVTRTDRPAAGPARCFLCGAQPARPYPAGLRCDGHAPPAPAPGAATPVPVAVLECARPARTPPA